MTLWNTKIRFPWHGSIHNVLFAADMIACLWLEIENSIDANTLEHISFCFARKEWRVYQRDLHCWFSFTSLCTTNFRCRLQSEVQKCNSNNTRNVIRSANTYLEMSIVVKLASYLQLSYLPVYLFSIVLSWHFRKELTITLSFSFYHKHCQNCQNYPTRIVDKVLKMTSSGCQKDRPVAF